MIVDKLKNCEKYIAVHPDFEVGFKSAVEFISCGKENGTYEITGKNVYASVSAYTTRTSGKYEAHRKYIDIQIIVSGEEDIFIADCDSLEATEKYCDQKDFELFDSSVRGTVVRLRAGDFCVIYPGEAHMPCIAIDGNPADVKKIVVKIAV